VATSPDGEDLVLTNAKSGIVQIIDVAAPEEANRVNVEGRPLGVAISPDGSRAFMANNHKKRIDVIDVKTGRLAPAIPTPGGGEPSTVAISRDGIRLFTDDGSSVSVLDIRTLRFIDTYRVGDNPSRIVVSPDGNTGYAAGQHEGVVQYDTRSGEQTGIYPTGGFVSSLALSADGKTLYLTSVDSERIVALDTAHMTSVNEIGLQGIPGDLVLSNDGRNLYAFHRLQGQISVVSTGL